MARCPWTRRRCRQWTWGSLRILPTARVWQQRPSILPATRQHNHSVQRCTRKRITRARITPSWITELTISFRGLYRREPSTHRRLRRRAANRLWRRCRCCCTDEEPDAACVMRERVACCPSRASRFCARWVFIIHSALRGCRLTPTNVCASCESQIFALVRRRSPPPSLYVISVILSYARRSNVGLLRLYISCNIQTPSLLPSIRARFAFDLRSTRHACVLRLSWFLVAFPFVLGPQSLHRCYSTIRPPSSATRPSETIYIHALSPIASCSCPRSAFLCHPSLLLLAVPVSVPSLSPAYLYSLYQSSRSCVDAASLSCVVSPVGVPTGRSTVFISPCNVVGVAVGIDGACAGNENKNSGWICQFGMRR